jgi:hypothetical protein
MPGVADTLGRPLHDLRISVTDRCNFRCTYCMPKEIFGPDYAFLPRSEVLTFEEITATARVFVGLERRSCGSPAGSRSCGATWRSSWDARRHPSAGRSPDRPDPDDERLGTTASWPRPLAEAGLGR